MSDRFITYLVYLIRHVLYLLPTEEFQESILMQAEHQKTTNYIIYVSRAQNSNICKQIANLKNYRIWNHAENYLNLKKQRTN